MSSVLLLRGGRWRRRLAPLVAVLALLNVLALFQVARADRNPSFRRGGQFLSSSKVPANRPVPYGAAPDVTTSSVPAPSSSAHVASARVTAPRTTSTKPRMDGAAPAPTATTAASSPLPATGIYTYAVS